MSSKKGKRHSGNKHFPIAESVSIALKIQLDKFLCDENETELKFPTFLSAQERGFIHETVAKLGLKSKSRGKGVNRYITIYKRIGSTIIQNDAKLILDSNMRCSIAELYNAFPITSKEKDDLSSCPEKERSPQLAHKSMGQLNNGVAQVPNTTYNTDLLKFREKLPVYEQRQDLLNAILHNQVMNPDGSTPVQLLLLLLTPSATQLQYTPLLGTSQISGTSTLPGPSVPVKRPALAPATEATAQPALTTTTSRPKELVTNTRPKEMVTNTRPKEFMTNTPSTAKPKLAKVKVNRLPLKPSSASKRPVLTTTSTEQPQPLPTPPPKTKTRESITFQAVDDSKKLLKQWQAEVANEHMKPPVVTEPPINGQDDVLDVSYKPSNTYGKSYYAQKKPNSCTATCKYEYWARLEEELQRDEEIPYQFKLSFNSYLTLKAILIVRSAKYSESYTVWWNQATGDSRIDYHNGDTSTYRNKREGNKIQSTLLAINRIGDIDLRSCVSSPTRPTSRTESAPPLLPDLSKFKYTGSINIQEGIAERWFFTTYEENDSETLTYRHELLVRRGIDNTTIVPLRYAVAVESSVLGDNSDIYAHHYINVDTRAIDDEVFRLNKDVCDNLSETDDIDIVEPLREFAMLKRSDKHEKNFQEYKKTYVRNYADTIEETVRKNVLMQAARYVSSANRQGASFELEINFLSDRLKVELQQLLGAKVDSYPEDYEEMDFPFSEEEITSKVGRQVRNFDWKLEGAVTAVRYQHTCAASWAFATVGAIEGALYRNTTRLMPLSEQCLINCAGKFGTKGCSPSWPNYGFLYAHSKGLVGLEECEVYQAQELQCKERGPITHVTGHVNVPSLNMVALKMAIRHGGPTVVLVNGDTTSFVAYGRGFYHDQRCSKDNHNHAMLAVGWTNHRGETYFILKNSWSTLWGEDGYIKVRAKTNTCGVLQYPSYPIVQNSDVRRIDPTAYRSA